VNKKSIFSSFWAVIIISLLALAITSHFGNAEVTLGESKIIASDTTWMKANGPYSLTENVLVNKGATLTIEADTTLNLNDYYLRVNGSLTIQLGVTINIKPVDGGSIQVNGVLTARGTSTRPIRINGANGQYSSSDYSSITFTQSGIINSNEKNSSGSIIENTVLRSTQIEIKNSLKITNNTLLDSDLIVLNGSPVISNNLIMSRISINGGSPAISNNKIISGFISFYGQNGGENAIITDNVISSAKTGMGKNTAAIWFGGSQGLGGHVLIQRNFITNNNEGIQIFRANNEELKTSLTIQNNTIVNNTVAVSVLSLHSPTIITNNIYNNSLNIKLSEDASTDINATYNWWGTTDTQAINRTIRDFKNNSEVGLVNFSPFLTAPNPYATPDPNAPPTTPNATPKQTPTPNPSTTSTPTATSSPAQTPIPAINQEPQQTEQLPIIIGSSIIIIVFGASLAFLVYLIKRK